MKNDFENFCKWIEACQLFGTMEDMTTKLGVDEQFIQEADDCTDSFEEFCDLLRKGSTAELTDDDINEANLHIEDMNQMAQYDNLINIESYV